MSFGSRIIESRKALGMSQDQLSKALGATPTTVGRYERDEVKPSIEMATKIAEVLNVSLDYLTGRSQNALKDKKMMDRFNTLIDLDPTDRDHILYAIDGLIKAAKLKTI